MLYSCCSSPKTCNHPKPTLQDWWSLAYCYYPRTVLCIEAVAKAVGFLAVMAVLYVFVVAIMLLG